MNPYTGLVAAKLLGENKEFLGVADRCYESEAQQEGQAIREANALRVRKGHKGRRHVRFRGSIRKTLTAQVA